jgi:hypothetical protein
MKKLFTTNSKLTLIAAAAAITFASPAFAKTVHHVRNSATAAQQLPLYNSTVVPPPAAYDYLNSSSADMGHSR